MLWSAPLVLATLAAAQGFLHLDVARQTPSTAGTSRLTRRQSRAGTGSIYAPIYQDPNRLEYIINITLGTPAQRFGVTLDTGSSDLWVPTVQMCRETRCDLGEYDTSRSSTFELLLEDDFNITYAGPGDSDAGDWVADNLAIANAGTIKGQVFGAALAGTDNHGVMGIGFDTNETPVNPSRTGVYPSVLDNLVSQGIISRKAFSLYLNSLNETTGSVIFGGVDTTKFMGDLVVLPLQAESEYFVTLTQVAFNDAAGATSILTPADYSLAVLLDSGTSETLLDADTVSKLAIGLGAVDLGQQSYVVPCQYANTNASVTYTFGGSKGVTVTVPVAELIGASDSGQCDLNIGPPIQGAAIMGDTFLRSAFAVFDLDNRVAALAQAVDGRSGTSSIQAIPSGSSIPGATRTGTAVGTTLSGAAAFATGTVPKAVTNHGAVSIGTPTFALGAAATSGVHNAAISVKLSGGQAILLGLSLLISTVVA